MRIATSPTGISVAAMIPPGMTSAADTASNAPVTSTAGEPGGDRRDAPVITLIRAHVAGRSTAAAVTRATRLAASAGTARDAPPAAAATATAPPNRCSPAPPREQLI